jgi:hypothetical protein
MDFLRLSGKAHTKHIEAILLDAVTVRDCCVARLRSLTRRNPLLGTLLSETYQFVSFKERRMLFASLSQYGVDRVLKLVTVNVESISLSEGRTNSATVFDEPEKLLALRAAALEGTPTSQS